MRQEFGLVPGWGPFTMLALPAAQTYTPYELAAADWFEPTVEDREPFGPQRAHEFASSRIITPVAQPTAYELVRSGWLGPAEARLRRVVTVLSATPVLADGLGTPIDTGAWTFPFQTITHPEGRGDLTVRWYLILDTDREAPSWPLATFEERSIPRGVGLLEFPDNWPDARYAWQSTYSDDVGEDLLSEGFLRLFVVFSAEPDAWRCHAGGLLHVRLQKKL